MAWIVTFEQSMVPSSGSVTWTLKATLSPKLKNPPLGGAVDGQGRHRVAGRDDHARGGRICPPSPWTVSTAVSEVASGRRCGSGWARVDVVAVAEVPREAQRQGCPGSLEPADEKFTASGADPLVRLAFATAIGWAPPLR